MTATPLSVSSRVSLPALNHTHTHKHTVLQVRLLWQPSTQTVTPALIWAQTGDDFTHKWGWVWKTHTHTYHNPDICYVRHACRRVHTQTHKNTLLTGHGFTVTHAAGEHTNIQTKTKCGLASSPSPILKLDAAGVSGSTKTLIWLQSSITDLTCDEMLCLCMSVFLGRPGSRSEYNFKTCVAVNHMQPHFLTVARSPLAV